MLPIDEKGKELIKKAKTITLLAHKDPDGDAMGACAALESVLILLGKTVEVIYPTAPDRSYSFCSPHARIASHTFVPDLLIALDTADRKRLYLPDQFSSIPLINIDHHASNSINGKVNIVFPTISSTCELLYSVIGTFYGTEIIDEKIASSLLGGMVSDTLLFQIPSTTSDTLNIAACLMEKGAILSEIVDEIVCDKKLAAVHVWGKLLTKTRLFEKQNALLLVVKIVDLEEHGLTTGSLAGLSNFLSRICDVDTVMLVYEKMEGETKVSLRSRHRDVNALASKFGGGGHVRAAGFVASLSPDQIAEQLVKAL